MRFEARHVEAAFRQIDKEGYHASFREPTRWLVLDPKSGNTYWPKGVLYEAAMVANVEYYEASGGPATNDKLRKLGFKVVPIGENFDKDDFELIQYDITEIVESDVGDTTKSRLIDARLGQGKFRAALDRRFQKKCAVTGCDQREVLRAPHITPWIAATNQERLDPENGILLAAHLDALFDKYLLSFEDNGAALVSSLIFPITLASL